MNLDAVLALVTVRLRGGSKSGASLTGRDTPSFVSLPIARVGKRAVGQGMWCASELWPADDEDVQPRPFQWRMRPAMEYAHLIDRDQIAIGHGVTRAVQETELLWPTRTLVGRVLTDRAPNYLRTLLRHVGGVGARCSQGYGRVIAWEVSDAPEGDGDWSYWGGITRRALPHSRGSLRGAIDPPYWHRRYWQPILPSGSPVSAMEVVS